MHLRGRAARREAECGPAARPDPGEPPHGALSSAPPPRRRPRRSRHLPILARLRRASGRRSLARRGRVPARSPDGKAMSRHRCPHTGLSLPECCCRRCCRDLVRRYAPQLLAAGGGGADNDEHRHQAVAAASRRPRRSAPPAAPPSASRCRRRSRPCRSSEGWQRWLRARRHFHTYSFHNQLLIAHQCPRRDPRRRLPRLARARLLRPQGRARRSASGRRAALEEGARGWREAGANPERRAADLLPPRSRSSTAPRSTRCPSTPAARLRWIRRTSRSRAMASRACATHWRRSPRSLGAEVELEPIPGAAARLPRASHGGRIVIDSGPDALGQRRRSRSWSTSSPTR